MCQNNSDYSDDDQSLDFFSGFGGAGAPKATAEGKAEMGQTRFCANIRPPSFESSWMKSRLSRAAENSKAGCPLCQSQVLRARFVCLRACCGPIASSRPTRIASSRDF